MSKKIISILLVSVFAFSTSCKREQTTHREIKQVLILGNSIVAHGPAPQIGWNGSWGMAASTKDSDFVHLLIAQVKAIDTSINIQFDNIAALEVDAGSFDFSRLDSFKKPDMLIVRLSENVDDSNVDNGVFFDGVSRLIERLQLHKDAVVVMVNGMWEQDETNKLIEVFAKKNDYVFVKNDDFQKDSSNYAYGLFTNPSVAKHPSDKGMRRIKERIWERIEVYFKK